MENINESFSHYDKNYQRVEVQNCSSNMPEINNFFSNFYNK